MAGENEGPAPHAGVIPPAMHVRLHAALEGAVYPLSRRELLLLARESEADRELITRLSTLPNAMFHGEREIADSIARRASHLSGAHPHQTPEIQ